MRPALRSSVIGCGIIVWLLGGCAQTELAQRVRAAAQPSEMPRVVACWEQAFETAGFRGKYLATVDFVIETDGALRDVAVRSFVDERDASEVRSTDDANGLRTCLHDALTETRLASVELDDDLTVVGYRIGFDDGSERARAEASERAPHLLIGPRANRCSGLYAHEPPRDVAQLQGELHQARGRRVPSSGSREGR